MKKNSQCEKPYKGNAGMINESPTIIIENAVAELYKGYFRLRNEKRYQEEYDAMGSLIDMLSADRQHMRQKYKLEI